MAIAQEVLEEQFEGQKNQPHLTVVISESQTGKFSGNELERELAKTQLPRRFCTNIYSVEITGTISGRTLYHTPDGDYTFHKTNKSGDDLFINLTGNCIRTEEELDAIECETHPQYAEHVAPRLNYRKSKGFVESLNNWYFS